MLKIYNDRESDVQIKYRGNVFNSPEAFRLCYGVDKDNLYAVVREAEKNGGVIEGSRIKNLLKCSCIDHKENTFSSFSEMLKYWGVSEDDYHRYVKLGYRLNEILKGRHRRKDTEPDFVVDHNGWRYESEKAMLDDYGVTKEDYDERMKTCGNKRLALLTSDAESMEYVQILIDNPRFMDICHACGITSDELLIELGTKDCNFGDYLAWQYMTEKRRVGLSGLTMEWTQATFRESCMRMYTVFKKDAEIKRALVNKGTEFISGVFLEQMDDLYKWITFEEYTGVMNRASIRITAEVARNSSSDKSVDTDSSADKNERQDNEEHSEECGGTEDKESRSTKEEAVHDHFGVEYSSLDEMCGMYGVSTDAYKRAIEAGSSIEDALTSNNKKTEKVKDHLGNEYDNVHEMCKHYGIAYGTFTGRIRRGVSLGVALTAERVNYGYNLKKNDRGFYIDHLGKEYGTVAEMCKAYGISEFNLYTRLNSGESLENVLVSKR